jgi:putative transposase
LRSSTWWSAGTGKEVGRFTGLLYHVLNRGVARLPLFEKPADYAAFQRVLAETLDQFPMRLLAYVLMPNHWHFVLWPRADGDLTAFCRWLTHTHTMRWHAHYHTSGTGHLDRLRCGTHSNHKSLK